MQWSSLNPEYVGCVLTCLGGGGISETETMLVCLAGCYGMVFLDSDETGVAGAESGSVDDPPANN